MKKILLFVMIFSWCLIMDIFALPVVYSFDKNAGDEDTGVPLEFVENPSTGDSWRKCFLPSAVEYRNLPENFELPVIFPQIKKNELDLTIFEHTGCTVIYFYTDDSGNIVGNDYVKDKFGVFSSLSSEITKKIQSKIMEKATKEEGHSYIVGFVVKDKVVEKEDLGICRSEDYWSFPKGYQKKKLNVIYVESEQILLDEYTKIMEFDGNDAASVFKYGKIENITVHSPVGNFVLPKSELPVPGLSELNSARLSYSEKTYSENEFALEFEEKSEFEKLADFEAQGRSLNFGKVLNIGRNYILNIKIEKDCGEYFISEKGWKIFTNSEVIKNILSEKTGKTIYGAVDRICFEVCLIENDGFYELVLKGKTFDYKSSYSF